LGNGFAAKQLQLRLPLAQAIQKVFTFGAFLQVLRNEAPVRIREIVLDMQGEQVL
jgi:hypothetical protein